MIIFFLFYTFYFNEFKIIKKSRFIKNATRFDEMQFNNWIWNISKEKLKNCSKFNFQVFSWILSMDFGQPILRHSWEVSRRCSLNLPSFLSTSRMVASTRRIFDLLAHPGQHLPPEDELGREELRILLGLDRNYPRPSDWKGRINKPQLWTTLCVTARGLCYIQTK